MALYLHEKCAYNDSKTSGYGYDVEFSPHDKLSSLFYNFSISEVLKAFTSAYYG